MAAFAVHTKTVPGGNVRCISYWLTKMDFALPSGPLNSDRFLLFIDLLFLKNFFKKKVVIINSFPAPSRYKFFISLLSLPWNCLSQGLGHL